MCAAGDQRCYEAPTWRLRAGLHLRRPAAGSRLGYCLVQRAALATGEVDDGIGPDIVGDEHAGARQATIIFGDRRLVAAAEV